MKRKKKSNRVFWLFLVTALFLSLCFIWIQQISPIRYGATFSINHARYLGLDPQQTLQATVEDLGVAHIRLPIYWSSIEAEQGIYNWQEVDTALSYLEDQHIPVTVVVGEKVPRWPECYPPEWIKTQDKISHDKALMTFLHSTITYLKKYTNIDAWQVENEPLFPFGECRPFDPILYKQELALVRSLDPRPIQGTVSGEWGLWTQLATHTDVLGISVYRVTWNDTFGYAVYPLPALWYRLRLFAVGLYGTNRTTISELQAEPWFFKSFDPKDTEFWSQVFDAKQLTNQINFAQAIHTPSADLWGVEWWYYLKTKGFPELWETGKQLIK